MVKHVSSLFKHKKSLPEEKIVAIIKKTWKGVTLKNISFNKGIVWLRNIPSGHRLSILFKKDSIKKEAQEFGIYIRDIM
jgi:hypothetical protein